MDHGRETFKTLKVSHVMQTALTQACKHTDNQRLSALFPARPRCQQVTLLRCCASDRPGPMQHHTSMHDHHVEKRWNQCACYAMVLLDPSLRNPDSAAADVLVSMHSLLRSAKPEGIWSQLQTPTRNYKHPYVRTVCNHAFSDTSWPPATMLNAVLRKQAQARHVRLKVFAWGTSLISCCQLSCHLCLACFL